MSLVKDFESLHFAIDSFIRSNSNFESSIVINTAIEEIEQCDSLQNVFTIPLQHKLLTLESALKWVFFLTVIIQNLTIPDEEDDDEIKELFQKLNEFNIFSSNDALKLIASIYDIGTQEMVLAHIDDESDSDSESDSDPELESVE